MPGHWQAIETGGTGRGIPDSNFCHDGIEGWIEFKAATAWAVDIRPEQIGWIHRRARAGGRVWIAVRRRHAGGPRLGLAVDELWLIHGKHIREIARTGLWMSADLVAGRWPGGPGRWPWADVWTTLAGR
jgi:hypothetical protein